MHNQESQESVVGKEQASIWVGNEAKCKKNFDIFNEGLPNSIPIK